MDLNFKLIAFSLVLFGFTLNGFNFETIGKHSNSVQVQEGLLEKLASSIFEKRSITEAKSNSAIFKGWDDEDPNTEQLYQWLLMIENGNLFDSDQSRPLRHLGAESKSERSIHDDKIRGVKKPTKNEHRHVFIGKRSGLFEKKAMIMTFLIDVLNFILYYVIIIDRY